MPISTIGSNSLNQTSDLTINGVTVGKGGGAVSTNTAVGASALSSNSAGTRNTAVGSTAASGVTGSRIVAIGDNVLAASTSGNDNVAIGDYTMRAYTGSSSTAVGAQAMANSTSNSGDNNTAIGSGTLNANAGGASNTAVGASALQANTTGIENTAVGYQALNANTTASYNTSVGRNSLYLTTTGTHNTCIGHNSGYNISTGTKNTILGRYDGNQGGLDIRTASNYIVLSDGDGNIAYSSSTSGTPYFSLNGTNADGQLGTTVTKTTLSANLNDGIRVNQIGTSYWNGPTGPVIQFRANGTATGNISQTSSTTSYNGTSDYRLKENIAPLTGALATVSQLKPVTFTWKGDNQNDNGFIAHELQEVLPNAVTGQKDAVNSEGNPIYQGIDPRNIVATLTAALQELKQIVDTQAAEIAELKAKVA